MKKPSTKNSRRKFLKRTTVATVTALSSLATGCATNKKPNISATAAGNESVKQLRENAAKANAAGRPVRGNATTKKLGELAPHPKRNQSAFKQITSMRLPGWRPDTADVTNPSGQIEPEYYFVEEALYGDQQRPAKYKQFPVPNRFPLTSGNTGNEFVQPPGHYNPDDTSNADKWHQFNSWILGGKLDEESDFNSDTVFNRFLRKLAVRARIYNAALHWIRRLHFAENTEPLDPKVRYYNSHGDVRADVNASDPDFAHLVSQAECDWKKAVDALNALLGGSDTPTEFGEVWADMIEVNGYIVSMRVVAYKGLRKGDPVEGMELGGSSSSHVYLSSAFSSPGP
jgi:hypothetical protein